MLGGRPLVWVWGWGWAWRTCRNQAQEAPGDEGWRTGRASAVHSASKQGEPSSTRPEHRLLPCEKAGHAVPLAPRTRSAARPAEWPAL